MIHNILDLKPISELLKLRFYIPAYQRGYRWNADSQVKALLEDVNQYQIDSNNPDGFYCMQPVVVKRRTDNDSYELIDGQQRLTTILLILHYFNESQFKKPKPVYSIEFETRTQQQNFLNIIEDKKRAQEDIDLFHLNAAYEYIIEWFTQAENKTPSIHGDFYSKLVNYVKIIWYEVQAGVQQSPVDIFARLNIGKIPLTNAELIKALFLTKAADAVSAEVRPIKLLQIAAEWDRIEHTLQKSSFWYFICPELQTNAYDTRIEFIFDLITHKKSGEEHFYTFYKFQEDFTNQSIDDIWLKIKTYFLTFEAWYLDDETYHLIGYLMAIGTKVSDIKQLSEDCSKSKFKNKIKEKAKKSIPDNWNELNYQEDPDKIRKVLLCFNILSILENSSCHIRFPFDKYRKEEWNIEHIRPQTDKNLDNEKAKRNWATIILKYFTGVKWKHPNDNPTIDAKIKNRTAPESRFADKLLQLLNQPKVNPSDFSILYHELQIYFKETHSIKDLDSIANLTLLDAETNKMYKNAPFVVKRQYIIEREKQGIFIPLCTKNIFLKAYSQNLSNLMHWQQEDGEDYLKSIKNTLNL